MNMHEVQWSHVDKIKYTLQQVTLQLLISTTQCKLLKEKMCFYSEQRENLRKAQHCKIITEIKQTSSGC